MIKSRIGLFKIFTILVLAPLAAIAIAVAVYGFLVYDVLEADDSRFESAMRKVFTSVDRWFP